MALVQYNPWQDAAAYGAGLGQTLGQMLIQVPQQKAMLAQRGAEMMNQQSQESVAANQFQQQMAQRQKLNDATIGNLQSEAQLHKAQAIFNLLRGLGLGQGGGSPVGSANTQLAYQKDAGQVANEQINAVRAAQEGPKGGLPFELSPQVVPQVMNQVAGMTQTNAPLTGIAAQVAQLLSGLQRQTNYQQSVTPEISHWFKPNEPAVTNQIPQSVTGVLPPQQRPPGSIVQTPKGTFRWNGQSWDPVGQPMQ